MFTRLTFRGLLLVSLVCFVAYSDVARAQEERRADAKEALPQTSVTETQETDDAAEETPDEADTNAKALRALRDTDPQLRQQAAEALARLAPREHLRLVHGYRLQERDARVRLALDWALYRIGKPEALFGIVSALETKHREQAVGYLARLDDPATLVSLLRSPKRLIKTGVLEALGYAGDERSAASIEPLVASNDLDIAAAAQLALTQIEARQGRRSTAPPTTTRPRQVGSGNINQNEDRPN